MLLMTFYMRVKLSYLSVHLEFKNNIMCKFQSILQIYRIICRTFKKLHHVPPKTN